MKKLMIGLAAVVFAPLMVLAATSSTSRPADSVQIVSDGGSIAELRDEPPDGPPVGGDPGDPGSPGNGTRGSDELLDYLIQDVCIDGSDNAVAGDPATCAAHRNIRIGEPSPYIVTDFDSATGQTYEAMNSIPVHGTDGNMKIIASKNLQTGFDANFTFSFDVTRDGYDLIDVNNSQWASYVRTSDPGCYDGIWSGDGSAQSMAHRAGGWILFPYAGTPSSWALSTYARTTTHHVQVSPGRPGFCASGSSAGETFWNKPLTYQFETGKYLTAIRSDHFASYNLSAQENAMEKYYYTREYGFTRWEAWEPQSKCFASRGYSNPVCHPEAADYPLAHRCSVMRVTATAYAGLDSWGNQPWVMTDCRDETNYIALNRPQIMVDGTMAQNDGYQDIYR